MSQSGRTIESVRRANLAHLLRIVHLRGPQSRAALTEETGLNRSTIADLVGELVRVGCVHERSPDPSNRVGRPSPVVAVDPQVVAIAVNPEVDALEIAAVGLDQGIRAFERIPRDELLSPTDTARLVAEQVEHWRRTDLDGARIVGVGLAVPGLVRAADGLVRNAPHLHWTDAPVRDLVAEATGLPVTVGNDASLGAIAEHLFGAAKEHDDVVYLNGGASGIGGGLIVQGMPVGGVGGYAGEFGQNRPGIATLADRRAQGGVLEDEVRRARLLAAMGLSRADDRELGAALAAATAPDATAEIERERRILATALANAVNVLNPSIVVLGGFLAILADLDMPGLVEAVRAQSMPACAEDLDIRAAGLAEHRLLIGAAEAAFAELLSDPTGVSVDPAAPSGR
ncbi:MULTISPECIES: ROK family protein [Microbacterium]|uniref:Sugar kinase of the NBD/HSP70 family, may contain an N-terminal HTH domain n=1 Tax=Microbacterium saccharophilum TaxID=1213358 RepID=A0A7Z7D2H8_9MICO|nr:MULTISPECIES: ROK family protein [Microbacterium]SFI58152.1 Sugar kinase of the NBD/HSP70 family, may contain an N-terminal HTH domain [Microbacterium saccharophilum]